MRNVWLIFREDAANLFRNVVSVIITVGLVVLPSMFAWYNILACWNVFDNTGNLPIAVANDDAGYTSELFPVQVNIGEKVVTALRGNDRIKWIITDGDDAVEGTKSGKYYAALVIPDDFSQQMLTFYEGDVQSVGIRYYVNEKKNAISPNITGAGADEVSYQVNEAFAETMAEVITALAKSGSQLADDKDLGGRIGVLTQGMRTSAARIGDAADVLGLYSSLATDSEKLIGESADLVESARSKTKDAVSSIDADKQKIRDLAETLASSLEELAASLDSGVGSLADIESGLDALHDALASDAASAADDLRKRASSVDARITDLSERRATLEQVRDDLHEGIDSSLDIIISGERVSADISREVTVAIDQTLLLDKAIASLSRIIDALEKVSDLLAEAADDLEAGSPDLKEKTAALRTAMADARGSFDALKSQLDNDLKPDAEKLKGDLATLAANLEGAAAKLDAAGSDLPAAAAEVSDALATASGKINDASAKLGSTAQGIRELADRIDAAVAAGDSETLKRLLQGNADDLAAAFTAPVQIERHALFPVENFGSAMAPLYNALALFIGSLLIMVAVRPEVRESTRERLRDPKPRQLYFGRFGVVALLSLMQTTLLGLGNMFLLKVQVSEPLLFMTCFWISGLVFAFMIYTMVVAFGNLGKALAVLLLIVQVTACGGSYPLPIMPDFVQAISPWVPATHVVDALRAAMFGVYQNDFWISMGTLALFLIPFLLLGLALRKPLEGFMKFYVSKVEESKMME